ncbi:hypothetical protein [Acinetobacter rudis]|uniref:Uncharacterized protein n=1 Tax=Acinetobacter rudis CIP 110305 TaxID=421052 RepID=S3NNP6_9GAMM|nr:hypothetical protein [Acinetobacter rudis]EPF80013.1 hypothetical protein F945_00905 [Acinetobacter rudis CIP 110305]
MVEQEKKVVTTRSSKNDRLEKQPDIVVERVEQVITSAVEKNTVTESQVATGMTAQFRTIKQELLHSISSIKSQLLNSQKSLHELGNFAKAEVSGLFEELTKLLNELKVDVSQISTKHKEHLSEALKRSKESGIEAWNKAKQ